MHIALGWYLDVTLQATYPLKCPCVRLLNLRCGQAVK